MVDMEPNPTITTTHPRQLPDRALVVGGSGKTGRRVIEGCVALGVDCPDRPLGSAPATLK